MHCLRPKVKAIFDTSLFLETRMPAFHSCVSIPYIYRSGCYLRVSMPISLLRHRHLRGKYKLQFAVCNFNSGRVSMCLRQACFEQMIVNKLFMGAGRPFTSAIKIKQAGKQRSKQGLKRYVPELNQRQVIMTLVKSERLITFLTLPNTLL